MRACVRSQMNKFKKRRGGKNRGGVFPFFNRHRHTPFFFPPRLFSFYLHQSFSFTSRPRRGNRTKKRKTARVQSGRRRGILIINNKTRFFLHWVCMCVWVCGGGGGCRDDFAISLPPLPPLFSFFVQIKNSEKFHVSEQLFEAIRTY